MAENGDRAGFEGSIAGQKVSLITKDVIPVLLLLAGLVGGYLIWVQVDKRFDLFQAHHGKTFELLLQQQQMTRDETAQTNKTLAIVNWNCTHSEDQQIPFGINGTSPAKPPGP